MLLQSHAGSRAVGEHHYLVRRCRQTGYRGDPLPAFRERKLRFDPTPAAKIAIVSRVVDVDRRRPGTRLRFREAVIIGWSGGSASIDLHTLAVLVVAAAKRIVSVDQLRGRLDGSRGVDRVTPGFREVAVGELDDAARAIAGAGEAAPGSSTSPANGSSALNWGRMRTISMREIGRRASPGW